jgi:hypothetical protein
MSFAFAIERLAVNCHLPQAVADDTRRANDVLDRVLSSAARELPEYLRRAFASEPESGAIAFIETLRFDVTINAEWPRDDIARALATQLVQQLWRSLDEPGTIRFKDRAEMLARFVLDLARGDAFTQSWHRRFAGLRLLPTSGIVRTLIVDESLMAGAALARLPPADLQTVIALLTEADAERAVAAIMSPQADTELDPLAVANVIVSQRCLPLKQPRQQLAFAIAMLRETGAAPDAALALARGLVQLASEPDAAVLSETEVIIRLDALMRTGGIVLGLDAAAAAQAVRMLSSALPGDQATEQQSSGGGIWLLLPHVLAVLDHDMALAPVALCALALAAGDDAAAIWRNHLLRATLDLDDAVFAGFQERAGSLSSSFFEQREQNTIKEAAEFHPPHPYSLRRRNLAHLRRSVVQLNQPRILTRAAARVAYVALSAYARRLPGFADSSFAHLWKNLLATAATLRIDGGTIEVLLTPPPLEVIWRMSGADRSAYVLPNGRSIRVGLRR